MVKTLTLHSKYTIKNYTVPACNMLKSEIKRITKEAIQSTKKKLKKNEITHTNFAINSSIERSFVTNMGHSIEKLAAIGEHVERVGDLPTSKRKKVTDLIVKITPEKKLRFEIKTSSNTKCGTDKEKMEDDVRNNREGWWVIAFKKYGEKNDKKCFQKDEKKRRFNTEHFWNACGIDYQELLNVWLQKDYIIDDMVKESKILN